MASCVVFMYVSIIYVSKVCSGSGDEFVSFKYKKTWPFPIDIIQSGSMLTWLSLLYIGAVESL